MIHNDSVKELNIGRNVLNYKDTAPAEIGQLKDASNRRKIREN